MIRSALMLFAALAAAVSFGKASEPLKISFWIWGLYDMQPGGIYHNLDDRMKEAADRGFNCIRLDDGAGLFHAADGRPRGVVKLHPAFGKFSADLRQMVVTTPREVDPGKNLVEFVRAADRHGISVILSSWYYLHTNWFLDESINRELNEDMPLERKFSYFADELGHAISLLRQNGLVHRIAYAEILNEFDGLPFAGRYSDIKDKAYADRLRGLHEAAIARLKQANPDVKFAYDVARVDFQKELVPRNVDVIAFHNYYMWGIYGTFEHGGVYNTTEEIPIPPETRPYLIEKPFTITEVVATRGGNLRTGNDWNARARLYSSLDTYKVPQVEAALEARLQREWKDYLARFEKSVANVLKIRDATVPSAELVFAEGVSYCASNRLLFEEHSDLYWRMLLEQQKILKKAGVRGSVVRTTNGPEDPAWLLRSAELKAANDLL